MEKIAHLFANYSIYLVLLILVLFGLVEALFGYLSNSKRTKDDVLIETVNTFFLMVITKPLITFLAYQLIQFLAPATKNIVAGWSLWLSLIVFLLADDLLQYWYHRTSHEVKWLWKWHRPHHAATEMGMLVSYREAVYFFMLMPNIWWLGIFTFMGGGEAVAIGILLKQIIVISSHSLVTWDSFFYKNKTLTPVIKVLERIFITPAFHHAHHAKSIVDDIGNPNGNYGNMLSIWDQLFGSAKFVHAFPTEYGLQTDPKESWAAHSFYPLIASDDKNSEISRDYKFEKTTKPEPAVLVLKPSDYLYCQCGYSKNQPFCDGSHHGTKFSPLKFTIKKEREYELCKCKTCKKGPFCDNSHLNLKKGETV